MSSRKKIIVDFMRHGEPEGGEVLRGRVDHPLSKLGWQQMQLAAAPGLVNGQSAATSQWTDIISSPLQRCRAFAEKLANGRLVAIPGTSGYVQHSAPEECVLAWRPFLGEISQN